MRIYKNTRAGFTHTEDPDIVELDLAQLSTCLSKSFTWASTPEMRSDPSLFVLKKYDEMRRVIERGSEIEMPWVYHRRENVVVMDGRHRLYALMDLGFTHALVMTDRGDGDRVRSIVAAAQQKAD